MKCQQASTYSMSIRATLSSYLVLSGIWVFLGIGYSLLALSNPRSNLASAALLCFGISVSWIIWLQRFKLTLSEKHIEYRNGLFRLTKVALDEIADIKNENIEWNILGRKIASPGITILTKNGERAMQINPKPFGRIDLKRMLCELHQRIGHGVKS